MFAKQNTLSNPVSYYLKIPSPGSCSKCSDPGPKIQDLWPVTIDPKLRSCQERTAMKSQVRRMRIPKQKTPADNNNNSLHLYNTSHFRMHI